MPNRLILEYGVNVVSIPLNMTVAQIRTVLKRYALQSQIVVEGRSEIEVAEDVLRSLKKIVNENSLERQRRELLEAQRVAMEVTLDTDNDL